MVSWLKQLDFALGRGKQERESCFFAQLFLKKKQKQNNNRIKLEMVVNLKIGSAMECAFKELNI